MFLGGLRENDKQMKDFPYMQQELSCILLVSVNRWRFVLERKTKFCFPTNFSFSMKNILASGSASIRYMARASRGFFSSRFFWGADSFRTGVGVLSVSLYQGKTLTGVQIGGGGGLGDMQRPGITQRRGYRFFARR